MEKQSAASSTKGRLVLATVKGDVHDIGKNLVDIICTNNGYEVHNIGIKVAIGEMIAKVKEVDADALGMSGLLVKSTLIIRDNLQELNQLGLSDIPVLLGGAALTRTYVERDLREVYEGRLFYGRDAFEGLHTLDKLMEIKRGDIDDPDYGRVPGGRDLPAAQRRREDAAGAARRCARPTSSPTTRCSCRRSSARASSRACRSTRSPPTSTRPRCSATSGSSVRRTDDGTVETDDEFKDRIRPQLRAQLAAAKASGVLVPQLVYGYFPANGDGNDLVVWTDESRTEELARLPLPAPEGGPAPVHRRLLPPVEARRRLARRARLRRVPHRHDGRTRSARRRPSCSPRTSTRTT